MGIETEDEHLLSLIDISARQVGSDQLPPRIAVICDGGVRDDLSSLIRSLQEHFEVAVISSGKERISFSTLQLETHFLKSVNAYRAFIQRSRPLTYVIDLTNAALVGFSHRFSIIAPLIEKGGKYIYRFQKESCTLDASLEKAHSIAAQIDASILDQVVVEVGVLRDAIWFECGSSYRVKLTEGRVSQELLSREKYSWWSQRVIRLGDRIPTRSLVYANDKILQARRLRSEVELPTLIIRRYEGVTVLPRQVVTRDNILLPETFRLFRVTTPKNGSLQNLDRDYAKVPDTKHQTYLHGTYFFLGSEYPGVFGHGLNEVLSRLWAWDEVLAQYPDCKALVSCKSDGSIAPWLLQFLEAFGINEEQIEGISGPARVQTLIGTTPGFTNAPNGFADPVLKETWDKLGDGLASRTVTKPNLERVFVTRPLGSDRICRNMAEVEEFARREGYAIVRPERMSLPEQASLFRSVRHLAGFGGSGMLNAFYSKNIESITVVAPETYSAVGEYHIARMYGANVNYFWETSEIQYIPGQFSLAAFHSPFTFDFEKDGRAFQRALSCGSATGC